MEILASSPIMIVEDTVRIVGTPIGQHGRQSGQRGIGQVKAWHLFIATDGFMKEPLNRTRLGYQLGGAFGK